MHHCESSADHWLTVQLCSFTAVKPQSMLTRPVPWCPVHSLMALLKPLHNSTATNLTCVQCHTCALDLPASAPIPLHQPQPHHPHSKVLHRTEACLVYYFAAALLQEQVTPGTGDDATEPPNLHTVNQCPWTLYAHQSRCTSTPPAGHARGFLTSCSCGSTLPQHHQRCVLPDLSRVHTRQPWPSRAWPPLTAARSCTTSPGLV